jgi:RNA polymerase sigma-70 factor (ECF subfamily)
LVAAIARQQQQALDHLYARYSTMVYCLARKVLQSHENAEEVVEEVFWQVWREAARYDAQRSSVRTWLGTLTRSRAIDARRSRRGTLLTRADINDLPVATDPAENPEEQLSRQQRALLVRDALERLPANQRAVLELAFFSGLSHAEIATHLVLPLGTVKTRIRGALLCLRERLRPLVGWDPRNRPEALALRLRRCQQQQTACRWRNAKQSCAACAV